MEQENSEAGKIAKEIEAEQPVRSTISNGEPPDPASVHVEAADELVDLFENPMVSIIPLAFDQPKALEKTIKTLVHHNDYPCFEVVISDNSIETPASDEINRLCTNWVGELGNVFHVRNKKNLMHGAGCMAGFNGSDPESKYICFANDDIFIPASQSDWLVKLVAFMEKNPNVATVTPAMYYPKETVYWIGKTDPEKQYHDFLHYPKGDHRLPTEPRTSCYSNFALVVTRRYLVEEIPIGQNCPHYGSDSEFANRIKDKYPDMEHWVLPDVKIYHYNLFAKRCNHGKEDKTKG